MFYNSILNWYSKSPRLIFFTFILGVYPVFYPKHLGSEVSSPWYEKLPTCPCENPDLNGVKIGDGWAEDKGNIEKYHKGAVHSYRSYPYVNTDEGKSGQQCCYDINGKLIKEGSGAGTPDKVSTCKGENPDGTMKVRSSGLWGHYFRDVRPWVKLGGENNGWIEYNKIWVPNKGNNCDDSNAPRR